MLMDQQGPVRPLRSGENPPPLGREGGPGAESKFVFLKSASKIRAFYYNKVFFFVRKILLVWVGGLVGCGWPNPGPSPPPPSPPGRVLLGETPNAHSPAVSP